MNMEDTPEKESGEKIPSIGINHEPNTNNLDDKICQDELEPSQQTADLVTTICKWCDTSLTGSALRWESDSIRPFGALVDHMR